MDDTIRKLEREYNDKKEKLINDYRLKITKHIAEVLASVNMFETTVRYKDKNKIGKICFHVSRWDSIHYEFKFYPMKKDGTYSTMNYLNVYEVQPDYENLKEKLLEHFEPIELD